MLNIIRRCNNIKISKRGKNKNQIEDYIFKKKSINTTCIKKTTMEFVKKCNHEETLKKIELDLEIFESIKSKSGRFS